MLISEAAVSQGFILIWKIADNCCALCGPLAAHGLILGKRLSDPLLRPVIFYCGREELVDAHAYRKLHHAESYKTRQNYQVKGWRCGLNSAAARSNLSKSNMKTIILDVIHAWGRNKPDEEPLIYVFLCIPLSRICKQLQDEDFITGWIYLAIFYHQFVYSFCSMTRK